jgi:hypothetical protein
MGNECEIVPFVGCFGGVKQRPNEGHLIGESIRTESKDMSQIRPGIRSKEKRGKINGLRFKTEVPPSGIHFCFSGPNPPNPYIIP